jgi:hypothetical protein
MKRKTAISFVLLAAWSAAVYWAAYRSMQANNARLNSAVPTMKQTARDRIRAQLEIIIHAGEFQLKQDQAELERARAELAALK